MSLAGLSWPGDDTKLCLLDGKIYAFHADRWDEDTPANRLADGGVYRYDPVTDSWTGLIHDSWTAKLQALGFDITAPPYNFTVTEIPRLGAFLMASSLQTFQFGAWLFKPPTA
jgi:hypothetical protein